VDVENVPLFLKNIITIDKQPITKRKQCKPLNLSPRTIEINLNDELEGKHENYIKGEK
jgi:hypothetical protein